MTLQDTIVEYAKKWYNEWKDILPTEYNNESEDGEYYDDGDAIDYIYEGIENRVEDFYEYMIGGMSDAEIVNIITSFYNEGLYDKIETLGANVRYPYIDEFAVTICAAVSNAFDLTSRIANELGLKY